MASEAALTGAAASQAVDEEEEQLPPTTLPAARAKKMDPEDFPSFSEWRIAAFSPLPGMISTEEMNDNPPMKNLLRFSRLCWFGVLFFLTLVVFRDELTDNDLTSALRTETIDDMFPDPAGSAKQLKFGEVSAEIKEELMADDISEILNWYTTFCRLKHGADDHILDAWECQLNYVHIGGPEPSFWNMEENRGLYDAEFYFADLHPKATIQEKLEHAEKLKEEKTKQALRTAQTVCSPRFLSWHMNFGDDPVGLISGYSHAGFGEAEDLNEQILKPLNAGPISPDFDQFTVLDRFSMFQNLSRHMDEQLGLTKKLDQLQEAPARATATTGSLMQTQLLADKQDIEAMSNESDDEDGLEDELTLKLQALKQFVEGMADEHRQKSHNKSRRVKKQGTERAMGGRLHRGTRAYKSALAKIRGQLSQDEPTQGLEAENPVSSSSEPPQNETSTLGKSKSGSGNSSQKNPEPPKDDSSLHYPYPDGCIDSGDHAGQMFDMWIHFDRDMNLELDPKEFEGLMQFAFPNMTTGKDLFQKLDQDNDHTVDVQELFDWLTENYDSLTFQLPGRLKSSCRNHHWSLLSACKPSWIEANFLVQSVKQVRGGEIPGPAITVTYRFEALGTASKTGWYKAKLDIATSRPPHDPNWENFYFFVMNAQLILVFVLLGLESLATLLLLPRNLGLLFNLKFDAGTPWSAAKPVLRKHLLRLFDGRCQRGDFSNLGVLVLEHVIFAFIVITWVCSVMEGFEPAPMPIMRDTPECRKAIFAQKAGKAPSVLSGESNQGIIGLSQFDKINKCFNYASEISYVTAMEREIFFESSGGWLKFVPLLLMLRLLELLDYSASYRWLPDTMRVAFWKLVNFMTVYIILVCGIAIVFTIKFGGLYPQFRNFGQTTVTLLLFSFGDTGRATEGMHPFVETSGTSGAIWLLFFAICITTIGLGFFTTIVLDAYTVAQEAGKCDDAEDHQLRLLDNLTTYLAPYFGCEVDESTQGEGKAGGDATGKDKA